MFGEIAKTFGRNFLVSCFVPAAVFIAAHIALWLLLKGLPLMAFIQSLETRRGILLLVCAFLLALAVSVIQTPLIKVFEGYEPHFFRNAAILFALLAAFSYWYAPFTDWYTSPADWHASLGRAWIVAASLAAVFALVWVGHGYAERRHRARFKTDILQPDVETRYELFRRYPQEENILPTKLGNCIRAFESHAAMYNIEPITAWYRLLAVIPKDFQEQIATAEANFQAVINLTAVALLLSMVVFAVGVVLADKPFLVASLILCALGYALYRFACVYARQPWGECVRSAFDLYRLDLLRQLGVHVASPTLTLAEEKKLWYSVQRLMLYGQEDQDYPVQYTTTRPAGPEPRPDAPDATK